MRIDTLSCLHLHRRLRFTRTVLTIILTIILTNVLTPTFNETRKIWFRKTETTIQKEKASCIFLFMYYTKQVVNLMINC